MLRDDRFDVVLMDRFGRITVHPVIAVGTARIRPNGHLANGKDGPLELLEDTEFSGIMLTSLGRFEVTTDDGDFFGYVWRGSDPEVELADALRYRREYLLAAFRNRAKESPSDVHNRQRDFFQSLAEEHGWFTDPKSDDAEQKQTSDLMNADFMQ